MKPAVGRSFCPRLSEACHILPLIRGHLIAAAPASLATALELLPIVEDGLFGYELVSERRTHIYPIIGCNAQGRPVLRKNSYGVGAPEALRLVTVNGRRLSRNGSPAHLRVQRHDFVFPDWGAAAESAWAQLLPLFPDRPRQPPVLREIPHQWLDDALLVARSRLIRWDPFIEFFGLPNEAHLGFALSGAGGEHGELAFHQPDTWALRWNAPPDVVYQSWSALPGDVVPDDDRPDGYPGSPERRARGRRATDRGSFPDAWTGMERRRGGDRRAGDRHAW
jgi:hypothetical protein